MTSATSRVSIGEVFEAGRPPQSAKRSLQLDRGELAPFYGLLHGGPDAFEASGHQFLVHFTHERVVPGAGAHLGDAGAHEPGADDADGIDLHDRVSRCGLVSERSLA